MWETLQQNLSFVLISGAYPVEAMHTFTQAAKHALAYKKENKK